MIRSVLSLRAAAGKAEELEAFYAQQGILDRASAFAGCRETVLLRATGPSPVTHLVIADWDSPADYDRWVNDPWRAAVSQQLATLLDSEADEPVVGAVFEFVPPR